MRFVDRSVPKINPAEKGGSGTDGGGMCFAPVHVRVPDFLERTAGKVLLVSDASGYAVLAPFAAHPRALSAVLDAPDALPLFSMPEEARAVFAAGNAETLCAARFFAAVRRIPCAVAPSDAACFGAFGEKATVRVDGTRVPCSLSPAEVTLDVSLMHATLADAVARLPLARLSRLEARALALLCGGEAESDALPPLPASPSAEETVRANVRLRMREAEGAFEGEGARLAERFAGSPLPAWRAFCELSALYSAFFRFGKPRRYCVADYGARAKRAGVSLSNIAVPSAEQYAARALTLERNRAVFVRELDLILRDRPAYSRSVCAFFGRALPANRISDALRTLPERHPDGLCAVIRDFGLMEEL